ncbi:MAG: Bax inhibitor-1/YccA family protein [Bacteriovoracaceae bacterium]|nr:Bax inhibitor-1/YccA family protein [Bacteriovoracaceae bacterium]
MFDNRTSGNPALKSSSFQVRGATGEGYMTQAGTYNKTAILLLICLITASFSMTPNGSVFVLPGAIIGFILAMVTIFKKEWSMYTAPLYAVCEGAFLGGISYVYQLQFPGIVQNAVMLTFGVALMMLAIFRYKIIEVTQQLRVGIAAATGAIFLVYLVSMIMGFFGSSIPMIHSAGPIGIGFSLVVVGIASFNLLLDFDFIERASEQRNAPKYMEWFGAFGLMVTLVWLYLELLRLLSKLNRR